MWTPVSSTWSDGFGMVLPVLLALLLVPPLQTGTPGSYLVGKPWENGKWLENGGFDGKTMGKP